jgi:hypothetical protein
MNSKNLLISCNYLQLIFGQKPSFIGPTQVVKGQIKPKADLCAVEFGFFSREEQKSNKNKFVRSFFGRICGVPICFRFYMTFRQKVNCIH